MTRAASGYDRAVTTLAQILDLAEASRRSPYARRVLFDALLDRYGDDFLAVIDHAQRRADEANVAQAVILSRARLPRADAAWQTWRRAFGSRKRSIPGLGAPLYAFRFLDTDARSRLRWYTAASEPDFKGSVLVTLVRPRTKVTA